MEDEKTDPSPPSNKVLEPGKAALAEKLHKKIQRAESLESLTTKKENIPPEPVKEKKEAASEETELDFEFSKLMDDLAANPDGVQSKKSKTLGRRYLQKVQIQEAIDNDLIAPPPSYTFEEEEDESEPEPPVKFRGKFKSIKDKKVERLILTYASHSDESATEMIPDEDASDFEEELKREIRSKDRKRFNSKKVKREYQSSGSENESKTDTDKKSGPGRGRNKENKPNNKQDLDYSYTSSSDGDSSSSSSSSSDDSDSEASDSEEAPKRGRRRNKRGRKKWRSDSSESEDEVVPRRTRRRDYKSSSDEPTYKTSQKNKKRKKKQESSESEDVSPKTRGRKTRKKWSSDEEEEEEEEEVTTKKGRKKGPATKKKLKKRKQEETEEESEMEEITTKTRSMKKKLQDLKKGKRRKTKAPATTSSESEEPTRGKKKMDQRRKKGKAKAKRRQVQDSSENSDVATKRSLSKSNLVVESDDTEVEEKAGKAVKKATPEKEVVVKIEPEEEKIIKPKEIKTEPREEEVVEEEEQEDMQFELEVDLAEKTNFENDSVIEKLRKIRDEELNRSDVREMKEWLNDVNADIKEQLENVRGLNVRHCWKKPQFGIGDDFLHGWQTDVKKYKENSGRFPKKLCQAATSPTKGISKKGSHKGSPARQVSSSPAKNTRSKSGIIKTSMTATEERDNEKLKVAARPGINSVMQRFFEKVLADSDNDCTKEDLVSKKFHLGPYSPFNQRAPTGLTPTPSVAPSMMASDDSDLDSLASLRTDLPASDSIPVSKRSIASSLLKKFGRKYNAKKLNSLYQNRPRSILEATNKPQLLPTPGIPTTEKDLKDMSPNQLKISTFFRKETVSNYRDNFEVVVTKNGINEFTPILYESRTRNKTRQIQDAATVKSVFGMDIPPHVMKKAEEKKAKKSIKKTEKKEEAKATPVKESSPVPVSRASTPAGSMLARGEEDEDSELRSERSESVMGESSLPQATKRAKRKFRKFRSGFDYIRKKKKVKPDDETTPSRRRLPVRRHVNWPEESRDVASEVRSWVVNKGLGETVIHKAARLKYHDVVVYCAESPDFDINVRDNAGYTPLHEACNRGHLSIAQVLLAHGASVNAPGYKGMRPLHEAVENGHGELARLLLAYGADPALTTYAGQTCLVLCADPQTVQLMEGYLADLKGRTGPKWHFYGPTRLFDPDEQGCDVFSNIPDEPVLPALPPPIPCPAPTEGRDTQALPLPVKTEGDGAQVPTAEIQIKTEKPDSDKAAPTTPAGGSEPSEGVDGDLSVVIKKEIIAAESTENEKESLTGAHSGETKEEKVVEKVEEEISTSEEGLLFETSEKPMLDVYEVEGLTHRYYLLPELLKVLKMTRAEFIIAARTIETVELSVEEFEKRVNNCMTGKTLWPRPLPRPPVVLVRISSSVDTLLGIETVKL